MRKASQILFLVGGIMSLACALGYLISAIVFIVLGSPALTQPLLDLYNEGKITTDISGTPEEIIHILQIIFMVFGICMIFPVVFSIVSAVVAFKARKVQSRGLFIVNIVFAIMGGVIVNAVGGVLALIDSGKKRPENE